MDFHPFGGECVGAFKWFVISHITGTRTSKTRRKSARDVLKGSAWQGAGGRGSAWPGRETRLVFGTVGNDTSDRIACSL